MSKISRGASWKEYRLADRLELGGSPYTVDVVARRATGVKGWRVTIVFLPWEEGKEVQLDLPNAASTAELNRVVRELTADPERIVGLFRDAMPV